MSTEAAIRWAGALAALLAASALMGFPAPAVEAHADVVLGLHGILQLGCAAVLLSTAHGAVANLAHRATEGARRMALAASASVSTGSLRWFGFAAIVFYALQVDGDVAAAEAEAPPSDTVKEGILPFLLFLAGIWAIYLSMVRDRGGPPRRPPAAAVTYGGGRRP